MAIVTVTIMKAKDEETKDRVVEGITKVMTDHVDPDPEHVRVLIQEIGAGNYAVAGKRLQPLHP